MNIFRIKIRTDLVADLCMSSSQDIQVNDQILIIAWTDLVADYRCKCFPGYSGK